MAIGFDENDDYYTVADAAELTLQDGDWCVGVWTYVSDNAGALYQYILSNNNYGANNSFNLFLGEAAEPTNANEWGLHLEDGDGTNPGTIFSGATGADSTWRLIICQRDDSENEIQMWFCEKDGVASKENSATDANFNAVNGGAWNVGRRVDGDVDRYYGSIAAEVFKGNFALTQAQIEALGAGMPIKTLCKQLGHTLDLYLPMWEADATLLDYSNNGNNGTRNSAPTTETHPPICTPVKRRRMG